MYLTPEQDAGLKELAKKTRVPVAEYIRQGVEHILAQHREVLTGQADLKL